MGTFELGLWHVMNESISGTIQQVIPSPVHVEHPHRMLPIMFFFPMPKANFYWSWWWCLIFGGGIKPETNVVKPIINRPIINWPFGGQKNTIPVVGTHFHIPLEKAGMVDYWVCHITIEIMAYAILASVLIWPTRNCDFTKNSCV